MTKKHFILLADAFRQTMPAPGDLFDQGLVEQWESDVNTVAKTLKSNFPRFNTSRWIGYIKGENGPNGGKVKGATA
jgi:hypothetical protein